MDDQFRVEQNKLRACLHGGGGPQIGEVTSDWSPQLSCKRDQIKTRDYVDRRVTHQSVLPHLLGVPHLHVNRPLNYQRLRGGGGRTPGVLNGETPPRGPTPYPRYAFTIFDRKGTSFVHLLLTNGTSFTHLI